MDFKGQTAVLSVILVLVGMMFLVPAITEKARGEIAATATGECGPEGQTHPCEFQLDKFHLDKGYLLHVDRSGTRVTWGTTGDEKNQYAAGDEKGSVTYDIIREGHFLAVAVLSFENPVIGFNKCSIGGVGGTCTAGKGYNAEFTYNLRSTK